MRIDDKRYLKKLKVRIANSLIAGTTFFVATLANSASWTVWYKVEYIYSQADGPMYVTLNPRTAHLNPGGCAKNNWYVFANFDDMYRMLLTAKSANRDVRVWVSDDCFNNMPVMLNT